MDSALTILRKLVDDHGAAKIAVILGHKDTITIKRWLKSKSIPSHIEQMVKSTLEREEINK